MEQHAVQFHENEQFFIEKLADFIDAGMRAGETCIVFATDEHLRVLENDLQAHSGRENYLPQDAHIMLSKFMVDSMPCEQRFTEVMESILSAASKDGSRRIRVFCELTSVLCTQGNHAAAIQLEQLWTELASRHAFSLLCACPMEAFSDAENSESFHRICQAHSDVYPAQCAPGPSDTAELRRTIAMLQQRQNALKSEVAKRKLAEARLSQREQALVERTVELMRANQQLSVEVEQRQRGEEKLKHIKYTLTEAQRIGHVGSWVFDVVTGEVEWSDELFRICGLVPQSVKPAWGWMLECTLHPEDREICENTLQRIMAGDKHFEICRNAEWALPGAGFHEQRAASKNLLLRITVGDRSFETERRFMRPDGTTRYGISRGELLFDDCNKLIRVVGCVADITEQKEVEQKLQESEERFRSLVDMSSDWYWEQDAQMRFTKIFTHRPRSPSDEPTALLGLSPWDFPVHCDDATRLAFHTALAARQAYHDLESWIDYPDQPSRYFQSSGEPMFDASGCFIGYRGVTREVTERMRNIESLQRFRAAMDSTADAIFLVNHASLTFIDANATACSMLGYMREELLLLSASELGPISPQKLRALSNDLVNGKNRGAETVWMQHKDGSRLLVEMRRHALLSGQEWIIVVVARDITQRRRTEAALRQSQEELRQLAAHQEHIKEEERKRIAREVHDELGGVLTGIKANISVSIDRAIGAGLAPDPLLVDSAQLADAAIGTVRRIITDLRPSVLDQLGVWAALDWYARQIQDRTGLQCSCIISSSAATIEPDPERSTMLFRVVQEALTNVVRHAAANHVTISVWREENAILVEIRDDGKGMDPQKMLDGESWGILGMHERTRHFGGNIKFKGTPGKGTAVLLRLPLEDANVK